MNISHLVGHGLTFAAVILGVAGFAMVYNGMSASSPGQILAGVPVLLLGLWWAGKELGRSNLAARRRRMLKNRDRSGRTLRRMAVEDAFGREDA